jgi:hypothetical protein
MTTTPMEPHEEHEQEIPAADPGRGAPQRAPGFGEQDEEADVPERAAREGEPVEPPD